MSDEIYERILKAAEEGIEQTEAEIAEIEAAEEWLRDRPEGMESEAVDDLESATGERLSAARETLAGLRRVKAAAGDGSASPTPKEKAPGRRGRSSQKPRRPGARPSSTPAPAPPAGDRPAHKPGSRASKKWRTARIRELVDAHPGGITPAELCAELGISRKPGVGRYTGPMISAGEIRAEGARSSRRFFPVDGAPRPPLAEEEKTPSPDTPSVAEQLEKSLDRASGASNNGEPDRKTLDLGKLSEEERKVALCLVEAGARLTSRSVSVKTKIPSDRASELCNKLARQGILTTKKGPAGPLYEPAKG